MKLFELRDKNPYYNFIDHILTSNNVLNLSCGAFILIFYSRLRCKMSPAINAHARYQRAKKILQELLNFTISGF
jgi:hypothetical protein